MTTRRRAPHLAAVTALAAAALVALAPAGGTRAGWVTEVPVPVPAVTLDTLAVAVTGTGPGTATVRNTAARTTAEWAPTRVTAAAGPGTTAAEAAGLAAALTVRHTGGAACPGALAWSAVPGGAVSTTGPARGVLPPGGSATLCQEVLPVGDLTTAYAGRVLTLTTEVGARSAAPATWTAAPVTWSTHYRVPFPAPVGPACVTSAPLRTITLTWTWGTGGLSPALTQWEVWGSDAAAGWTRLRAVTESEVAPVAGRRSITLDATTLREVQAVKIRGAFGPGQVYGAESTETIGLTRVGATVRCGQPAPNPAPAVLP